MSEFRRIIMSSFLMLLLHFPGWWWWIIVVIVGVAALTIITVAVIRRKRTQGNETQTDDNVADPEDGVSYASIRYARKTSSKARKHFSFSSQKRNEEAAATDVKDYFRIVRVGDEATLPCDNVIHDQDKCESTVWYYYYSENTPVVTLVDRGQIQNNAKAKSHRLRVTEKCSLVIKKVTEENAGSYICRQFRSGQQGQDSVVYLSVVSMTEHQDNDEVTLRCSVSTYGRCRHTVKWLIQGRDVVKDHREIKTSQSPCSASTFSPQSSGLLMLIIVSVGLAALIITVVTVNMWTRAKEKKKQMDEINVRYDVDDDTVNYENIRPLDGD
ncbi:Butyrophilin-like protein 1 [Dissostichus eleginoides]|uniref:Butyrophilin-like protein 1 n=1 Tax=Dissostichus eleginoides TaxID=100907 RepID=A0AAD9BRI1_DISEL|nr:Butyrophilin-like protein 1 [Dissostichus eleginoides]